ncbi:MAG TPA: hypothetical protein VN914_08855 [Polyangia bacterium]|nr:hypothetical protein [Polyangia bacterium]
MAELAICVGCGKNVDPAAAFIHADGLRCPACNARAEVVADQARLERREVEDLEESLSRRAVRLAKVHAVMWAVLVIILAKGQDGWYTPLLVLPFILFVGLVRRKRWGYHAALALDSIALGAAGILAAMGAWQLVVAVFVGLCAAFLLALVVFLREAFRKPPVVQQDPEVPNLMSRW